MAREPEAPAAARVLHVISGLFYGGGQQVVLDLMGSLPDVSGGEARLCVLGDRDATMAAAADYCVACYDGRYNRPATLWRTARALRQVIREAQPDVVHSHGWDASMAAGIALRGAPRPHVVHWHTSDGWMATKNVRHGLRRSLTRWLFRQSGVHVIAVSHAVRNHLCRHLGVPAERLAVIHNGIDAKKYQPDGAGREDADRPTPLIIGTAARLAPLKGLEYLIDALAMAKEDGVVFEWQVAGEGSSRDALGTQAAERGLTDRVRWLGRVEDMRPFYGGLDVFVLPSLSEGLPLTILEAMASGAAIVCTPVGGIPEAVEQGREGVLVPPRDAPALAAALKRLSEAPEERRGMGASARRRVLAEFTLERTADQFAQLYRQLINHGSGR